MSNIKDSIYEILECNFSETRDENKERALANILELVQNDQVICAKCIYYTEYEVDSIMVYGHCSWWGKDIGGCHTDDDASCSFGKWRDRPGTSTVNYTYREFILHRLNQLETNIDKFIDEATKCKAKLKDIK